jgi:hypothetical protein
VLLQVSTDTDNDTLNNRHRQENVKSNSRTEATSDISIREFAAALEGYQRRPYAVGVAHLRKKNALR